MPVLSPEDLSRGCTLGQAFGGNANASYAANSLRGHTGLDIGCGYGSDVHSHVDGTVINMYLPGAPASDGYTAIFILCQTPLEIFEMSVGHVSAVGVSDGQVVHKGDVIGKEGNCGTVYSDGQLITLAMQRAGDHRGSHRHWQKRPVRKVLSTSRGFTYIPGYRSSPYRDASGSYYEIMDFWNGYNGCVDWGAPLFNRPLSTGSTGYDVFLLQKALVLEGFALFAPTGYFGGQTALAVSGYQKKIGIVPVGLVGPRTRADLNSKYAQL